MFPHPPKLLEILAPVCMFLGLVGLLAAIVFGGYELVHHIRWK